MVHRSQLAVAVEVEVERQLAVLAVIPGTVEVEAEVEVARLAVPQVAPLSLGVPVAVGRPALALRLTGQRQVAAVVARRAVIPARVVMAR